MQSRKAQKSLPTDQVQKHDLLSALENASCGMSLGQLLQGDVVQERKDLQRFFSGKISTKVTVYQLEKNWTKDEGY